MVAPARLKVSGWLLAAALAAGFLGILAFEGERPEPGLARFAPAGLLAKWPVHQVMSVDVSAGTDHRSFHRNPTGGWRLAAAGAATTADLAQSIETGLKLLHNSAPERTDLTGEQLGEFGLEPAQLTVTAHAADGDSIAVEFGGRNPLGLERYARVVGRAEILLMPGFVADAWERVAEAQ